MSSAATFKVHVADDIDHITFLTTEKDAAPAFNFVKRLWYLIIITAQE